MAQDGLNDAVVDAEAIEVVGDSGLLHQDRQT
jgi:hypothetical protein